MSDMTIITPYPIQLDIDYPDRPLNRLTSGFRLVTAIPVLALLALFDAGRSTGLVTLPVAAMQVVRRKYPRWWFDWNLQLVRFETRVCVYLLLLDDRYPATDEEQGVRLNVVEPDVPRDLNRWLPLVKWILAIPHYIALVVLFVGVVFVSIGAWFTILFTGRYPRRTFGYVVGVLRWATRVQGYAFTLVTDEYPPFRLAP